MNEFSKNTYKFGDFSFDASKLALYHQKQLIKNGGGKPLQVLAVLLQNANTLASHDEIIEQVWQDNISGVTAENVAQYISKLRKAFAEYEPDTEFIQNVKGRGYVFVGEVSSEEPEISPESSGLQSEQPIAQSKAEDAPPKKGNLRRRFIKPAYLFATLFAVVVIFLVSWNWRTTDDEQEIRRVVEDSQKFESLVLYENPQDFDEAQLAKYWMPNKNFNADYDFNKVREGVQRLVTEGRYYGKETKLERFDFEKLDINSTNDYAVVKTLEKWFIVEYRTDGTLLKTKNVGPYFVSYILQKVDGRWLIEKSNTARAEPAPPQ
ncbi:hypothetical protein BH20ACI1_BH20ACI1_14250 [soil metagenome]